MIISRPSEKLHQTSFAGFLMPIHGPEGPNEPPGRIVRALHRMLLGARSTHYGKALAADPDRRMMSPRAVDNVWANRVEPVIERIRQLSSRFHAVQLGIDLSDELTRDIKLLADYEFDVSNLRGSDRILIPLFDARFFKVHRRLGELEHRPTHLADFTSRHARH